MSKPAGASVIRLQGVRQNNLKNFDLDLPLGALIVVTGLSGSGKSSLAFDTLYAEGQRRYIETFSPYARQFFDRMDRPQVDSIQGIPPAIAIEQRNAVKTTRSTVGTMTEICDYMKMAWPRLAQLYCRKCGRAVCKQGPEQIWDEIRNGISRGETEATITFELALSEKLSLPESLGLVSKQGYQRLLVRTPSDSGPGGEGLGRFSASMIRIEDAPARWQIEAPRSLTVVQDRLEVADAKRARFIEACEQAYHFGKGKLSVWVAGNDSEQRFSRHLHCAECDLEYRDPSPALFSFNHPIGACPTCRGFGRTIAIDYDLAIPDRSLTLAGGAIKPWQIGHGLQSQKDLLTFCRKRKVPTGIPFRDLPPKWQEWVLAGDPDYGKDAAHEWPRAWYGVKGYFRWLESKAYKMHVRVLLSRYRAYRKCSDCGGRRFQPESLLYRVPGLAGGVITLADFYQLPVRDALKFVDSAISVRAPSFGSDPWALVFNEVRSRLQYLNEVGLGYLSLDRPTRTLSGGETERVNLTTCLGSRLVNTLFVLDEPSVGLHARDTGRLVGILRQLRNAGNTVVVVEHEAIVMQAADQIVDLGPGQGEAGGQLVFQGALSALLKSHDSITGQYLSGRKQIDVPPRRPVSGSGKRLVLSHARAHNLKDLTIEIPLERFVCLTGVSGSGKTTLMRDVLLPALETRIAAGSGKNPISSRDGPEAAAREQACNGNGGPDPSGRDENLPSSSDELGSRWAVGVSGADLIGQVIRVDQSAIGKTPRSNPAVYIGAFDPIRDLFAQTELARQRGLKASSFSFNSTQGQCEVCRGAGFEKIEMQFLSDVYIRCAECHGRRYREHILEVKLATASLVVSAERRSARKGKSTATATAPARAATVAWSIADLLDATVDEAIRFLRGCSDSRSAAAAVQRLELLQEVGLGYLRLGQPINTLSGGESQRLKLVRHLADSPKDAGRPTLFLFDEPTTGLHFHDVAVLLQVFQRLVDSGHSVIVIEHNLDVIKSADWLIDLGPEAGNDGGKLVIAGTVEDVMQCPESHTGRALRHSVIAAGPNGIPANGNRVSDRG